MYRFKIFILIISVTFLLSCITIPETNKKKFAPFQWTSNVMKSSMENVKSLFGPIQYEEFENRISDAYDFIDASPLISGFPFIQTYQITEPTEYEKTGIAIGDFSAQVLLDKMSKDSMKQYINSAQVQVFAKKNKANINQEFEYKIDHSLLANMESDSIIVINTNSIYTNAGSETFFPIGSLIDVGSSAQMKLYDNGSFDVLGMNAYYSIDNKIAVEINEIRMKDFITDELFAFPMGTYGDTITLFLPKTSKINIGDTWERQMYRRMGIELKGISSIFMNSENEVGTIILYTYEVVGFTEIDGVRCALIEFISEAYEINVSEEMTDEEFKAATISLTKSNFAETRKYFDSVRSGSGVVAHQFGVSLNISNIVQQSYTKSMGIIAYDYNKNIILEAKCGAETNYGLALEGSLLEGYEVMTRETIISREMSEFRKD